MDVRQEENNYEDLLNCLKSTVESLLGCHPSNIWDVYGGIQRVYVAITKVLRHGFRFLKDNGEPDFWVFIQGLSWLNPTLAASPSFLGHPSTPIRSPLRSTDKAMSWLYKSIENHTLSEKLSWLLSDHEHLLSCYKTSAFLRQTQFSEATLICLRAVEQREINLLTKIDPVLYLKKKSTTFIRHRRCLSYPESKTNNDNEWCKAKPDTTPIVERGSQDSNIVPGTCFLDGISSSVPINVATTAQTNKLIVDSILESTENEKSIKYYIRKCLLKRSHSSFDVYLLHHKETARFSFLKKARTDRHRRRSASDPPYAHFEDQSFKDNHSSFTNLLQVRYDKPQSSTGSRRQAFPVYQRRDSLDSLLSISSVETITNKNKAVKKKRKSSSSFFTLPFQIWETSEDGKSNFSEDSRTVMQTNAINGTLKKKSFIENGGYITLPMSMGSYPKPSPGQTIMSFLQSGVFTHTNAELDRENAHFNISEALIAALEQMKFNQQLKAVEDILEESDEEINELKRSIQIRRQQKRKEKIYAQSEFFSTDTTITTDPSVNSLSSSSVNSTSESISTDQDEEESDKRVSNLSTAMKSGLSVSKLSIQSTDRNDFECHGDSPVSAESVAISLLTRFKENQLPAASDIEWLVSERDVLEGGVCQQILPLPNFIFGDGENGSENRTLLRGTSDWAPPRPQIIFTIHPSPVRRELLAKQAYRCAGCGTVVAHRYASKFRYCEYLGRYFCTGCHSEQTAIIPSRVLQKWDFAKYPVSNFSYKLLDQMSTDPLFNVMDLNASLYCRARGLHKIRLLRLALFYLKDFIFTCKFTEQLQHLIKSEPSYIYTDPDCYSLVDFINVKNNKYFKKLSLIVKLCESHTHRCQMCKARGSVCEICEKEEIIFPWELSSVICCNKCYSCNHIKCYKRKLECPKCIRINKRNDFNKIEQLNKIVS